MPRWELLLGIVAAIAAFWRQAVAFVAWMKGWVIVSKKTDYMTGTLMLSYLESTMRRSKTIDAAYGSAMTFVRPLDRIYRVVYQSLAGARQVFWKRGKPLWYGSESVSNQEGSGLRRDYHMRFSFLRGTYDWEKLLVDAAAWEDQVRQGHGKTTTRYRVYYHYGTRLADFGSGSKGELTHSGNAIASPESDWNNPTRGVRLLQWSFDDVQGETIVSTMDSLSLRPELTQLADELKFWHRSQTWYQQHGIPWRRGVLLWGGPGTGKTSFARAIAELLDLPVHVFDLAGMSNQDLKRAWRNMLETSPCIALLEDLDAVFEGRKNVAPPSAMSQGVTFNELLNCIDGIERVDGMLLVVTTNCLDKLDPALVDRPGRIDSKVEFKSLDHEGRVKMATRILDDVELAVKLSMDGAEDSAAQFQERCFRIALARRFSETRAA